MQQAEKSTCGVELTPSGGGYEHYGSRRNLNSGMLVDVIADRGLINAAIFVLEMGKPLVGCVRELFVCTEPLFRLISGEEHLPAIRRVLESSEQVELFIQALEERRSSIVGS